MPTHYYIDRQGVRHDLDFHEQTHVPRFGVYRLVNPPKGGLPYFTLHDSEVKLHESRLPTEKPALTMVSDIKDFHEKFGLIYDGSPRKLPPEMEEFRMTFFKEEYEELTKEGATDEDKFDACIDLMYIILGYCYLRGWDVREGWSRVHAANMAKVRAEKSDQSKRGSHFDVIKPDGWKPPVLSDLVAIPDAAEEESTDPDLSEPTKPCS